MVDSKDDKDVVVVDDNTDEAIVISTPDSSSNDLEPKLDSDRDNSRRIDDILSTNLNEKVNLNVNRPKKTRIN